MAREIRTDNLAEVLLRVIDNLLDNHIAMSMFSHKARRKLAEYLALGLADSSNYFAEDTYLAFVIDREDSKPNS